MGRIIHFDILKCLAIFMVVVGHCLQRSYMAYDVVTTSFYDDSVFKFIYGCHLPLFMAISGYFFYGTIRKYTFREVVKSRFTRFVVPIITWHVFWMITDGFSNQGNGYTCSTFIKGFLLHYWFLWAVFFCSLAVLFVRKLFGEGLDIYFILIPLSLLLPNALNISRYVFLFPYFLIGYVWQIKKKDFTSIQAILGGAISFFLYIVLLCFFSQEHFIYTSDRKSTRLNSSHL